MGMSLISERIEVESFLEAIELYFERGWTDGLAIVPPTEEKIEEMVRYVGRDPLEVIGEIPPRYGIATIETLAINSVMAGCLPEYFPVVIAAVEAILEPEFNLNGVQTNTHSNEPLIIVSGPAVKKLNINCGYGAFGSGFRANGTIGRAVNLILWNLGGSIPGEVDRSVFAHPGKWSYCIGENQEGKPWEPIHVERGLTKEASAVTVFSCEAPHSICCFGNALEIMITMCDTLATLGSNNIRRMGQTLVVIGPRHAGQLAKEGWSADDVRNYIWENARISLRRIIREVPSHVDPGRQSWPKWVDMNSKFQMIPLTKSPQDILIAVAGGEGSFSMCCPGWGAMGGLAVTKEIRFLRPKDVSKELMSKRLLPMIDAVLSCDINNNSFKFC